MGRHAARRTISRWLLGLAAALLLLFLARGTERIEEGDPRVPEGRGPDLEARVVHVFDGDSMEVLSGGETVRVRLFGIDAPERDQPWAKRSRQALSGRVLGEQVRIREVTTDRYGRMVGEVYADGACVGCELVRDGHVWVYRHYSDDPVLLELEAQARSARRGLWSLAESERVPPWEWRRSQRERERHSQRAPERHAQPASGRDPRPRGEDPADPRCGTRKDCRAMKSCAEARFHLDVCGTPGLDGDGDGVPCEFLCRGDRPDARSGTE